jgi:hypothetical protein
MRRSWNQVVLALLTVVAVLRSFKFKSGGP